MTKIIPVILCGGSGTRLWPLSSPDNPKQFINLFGEHTMVQETVLRAQKASGAKNDECVFVTLHTSKAKLFEQINELGDDYINHILCEPHARNTAAAVALATHYVEQTFGYDAILWVLPSDHYIADEGALKVALDAAVKACEKGCLTTFGIRPSKPETGYGYIQHTDEEIISGALNAKRFVEKPDEETAQSYIESGDYLWNSGMFVFKVSDGVRSFETLATDIWDGVQAASENTMHTPDAGLYEKISKQPFDKAIMEKSDSVAVVPCAMGWSDIGSWESLWEMKNKDKNGEGTYIKIYKRANSVTGLKKGETAKTTTISAGAKNLVIIETDDAILIADQNDSAAIKKLAEKSED